MFTKRIFQLSFLLSCTLAIISCGDTSSKMNSDEAITDKIMVSLQDTISLDTFNVWTARWQADAAYYMNNDSLKYFSMPKLDLKEFLKEQQSGVRFYLGMDATVTPHIILVGTDGNGNISVGPNNHIFDVSTPCPTACGDK